VKINIVDIKNKKVGEIKLDEFVFGQKMNVDLLAQYIRVYLSNQRQGTSSTKTRSEVSGGGKKPWKQKGTGRARHGSTRSPIWRHGGISHGPKPKSWVLKMPKKLKNLAMRVALSYKIANKNMVVLDKLEMKKPSTRKIIEVLKDLKLEGRVLIVQKDKNEILVKSVNNLKKTETEVLNALNTYQIVKADSVVFFKDAVEGLQIKLNKNATK